MRKNPLIGVSIIAVVLLVLGSLTNVVGYQSAQSSGVNESPLFSVRTNRANHENNKNVFTSKYLGKGQNSIPFPERDNRTEKIQKVIDEIRAMDDATFNRFVDNVVNQVTHRDAYKDIDSKDVIKGLRLLRESPKNIMVYNDTNNFNRTYTYLYYFVPTICWFPGCVILTISLCVVFEVIMLIALIIILSGFNTGAICLGPPTKNCILK
jgi:hypothetical protein